MKKKKKQKPEKAAAARGNDPKKSRNVALPKRAAPKRRRRPKTTAIGPATSSLGAGPIARPWTVRPEDLARLDDYKLKPIFRALLHAAAHRAGCDQSRVIVNADDRAADGGADAITPTPARPCTWLGDRETCWQLKVGTAGEPARLSAEIVKSAPSACLTAGGRVVVVASGATSGDAGRKKRLATLLRRAKKAKLPTDQIVVLTSETLATWLDEHPGLAAEINGLPDGCQAMEFWERDPHHAIAWQAGARATDVINALRRELDPSIVGAVAHVHLIGQPGVGKTRLALEACRGAGWRHDVLYVADGVGTNVDDLLMRLLANPLAAAVVVVDDASAPAARRWNSLVLRAPSQLRLLTISTSEAPAGVPVAVYEVGPLTEEETIALIAGWYPNMPDERRRFIASFSQGYVRLAKVSSDALDRNRDLDVPALLREREVRQVLDALLGDPARRESLYVLAVLESVGWEGNQAIEGRAIAAHLGLDWDRVRDDVEVLHRAHGIAPRAGNLRYLSPRPLGALVATEAWQLRSDKLRTLFDLLPTPAAQAAYEARLRSIATAPQVQEFAALELGRFADLGEVRDEADARRWGALGYAHPEAACRLIARALGAATSDARRAIAARARRHLIHTLVEFGWRRDCFHDAALALAHLAVPEMESYANNATGEFLGKFQIVLGGTAAPYTERFALLDELRAAENPAYRVLVVKALAQGIDMGGEMRMGAQHDGPAPAQPEWRPKTVGEHADIVFGAIERLTAIATTDADADVLAALLDVCRKASLQLRVRAVRDRMADLFRALAHRSPELREGLWREIHGVIDREEKYWKQLDEHDVAWLRALMAEHDDSTLEGRVRREVAVADFTDGPERYEGLASEVVATPSSWSAVWSWLTTRGASGAWAFGEALARADLSGKFGEALETLPLGPDLRALAAYLRERGTVLGADWIDDWVDRFGERHATSALVVAELTWRATPTERGARRFLGLVRSGEVHARMSEQLSYGGWAHTVPEAVLLELVTELAQHPEHRGAALVLIEGRVERDASFLVSVEQLAIALVAAPALVRESPNHGYYWHRLASALLAGHVRAIARAIFAAHDPRSRSVGWFIQHSTYAALVLRQCVAAAPQTVWEELIPYLENSHLMPAYAIGLPPLLDDLPRDSVLRWIAESPSERGALVARLIAKRLDDQSIFVEILDRYGHLDDVASALRAHFFTGQWSGDPSKHWDGLASQLEPLAARDDRPRAAQWARSMITSLKARAEFERQREAEQRVRGF